MPVVTVNEVLEQFLGDRIIHVLCIDVEGSEKAVTMRKRRAGYRRACSFCS